MTTDDSQFDMSAAPMRIGTVRLKVRHLATVSGFYQQVLGLAPIETVEGRAILGIGSTRLIELEGDPTLAPLDPRQVGLFHVAFLMPTRADLARWVAHVAEARVPLQGASDHIVSEALYLADPEGNGIEVYADRPSEDWRSDTGEVRIATSPLDVPDLLKSADGTEWSGFPEGGSVGHVHLQVGDTAEADRFYRDVLGFDIAARYPGASFYGSGGYHHQLAGNIWNSRKASSRPKDMAGLSQIEIVVRDSADLDLVETRAESAGIEIKSEPGGVTLHDPWGTAVTLRH